MKPKYRHLLRKALPGLIVITATAQVASAVVIMPDGFGNVLVNSGANNVVVPPGQPAMFSPFEIRLDPGVFMTPAGAAAIDIQDPAANYTVNMGAGSSINAGPNNGITSAASSLTVNANGTITGGNGISISAGSLTVVNNSTITGTAGAGIISASAVSLTNNFGASVIGSTNGVIGGVSSVVSNFGTITGQNGIGVIVGNSSSVANLTTFSPFSGGQITGSTNGVVAGNDLLLLNQNGGSITGTSGNGIVAGSTANITNNAGATITGDVRGVDAGDGLTLLNHGNIFGNLNDGVRTTGDASITNTGSITSNDDGIAIEGGIGGGFITNSGTIGGNDFGVFVANGVFELNNTGEIYGSTAIRGSNDAMDMNFNLGSRVIGSITGNSATDTIDFNGGLTSPFDSASGSSSNSILGSISGIETINKSGSGVAFIGVPGNGGFTISNAPTINITGGGLYMNANINAGATINAGGAALGGTGTWNSTVNITAGGISAGAIPINLDLNPVNAVGTLNLVGNVTHSSGTFIRHDLVPDGVDDLINHSGGTYALGANTDIRVSVTSNDTVIRDGTYTVVDSNAVITGGLPDMSVQFNTNVNDLPNINTPGGIDLVGSLTGDTGVGNTTALINQFMSSGFTDGGTNLVFTVQHDFEGLAGLSSNASSLGAALDASVNLDPTLSDGNAIIQDFIAALDYSDLATVQETMESVIPDNVLGAATALVGANYRLHRVVEDHLAMTRSGGTIVETPAMTDSKGGMIPAQVTTTGGGMGNVWGTVSYDWRDSSYGTTDIDGEDASFTVGVDYRVAPNLLIGILADGTQSSYDYTGGGTDTDSYRFAAYATYGESTGLYADFLVAYGNHDLDTSRSLGGLLAGTSYNSSTDADSLQAMLTVGYTMESGCVKHGPFAGLEYQNIDVDGFSASGLGAFGGVGDFDIDSLRLLVGYRAQASYGNFTPFGSIAYAHEFEDGPVSATATIPGGATFSFDGGGLDSAVLITLGTGYTITENLSATFAYHGEISTGDGADSHGASIGLNYEF